VSTPYLVLDIQFHIAIVYGVFLSISVGVCCRRRSACQAWIYRAAWYRTVRLCQSPIAREIQRKTRHVAPISARPAPILYGPHKQLAKYSCEYHLNRTVLRRQRDPLGPVGTSRIRYQPPPLTMNLQTRQVSEPTPLPTTPLPPFACKVSPSLHVFTHNLTKVWKRYSLGKRRPPRGPAKVRNKSNPLPTKLLD